MSRKLLIVSDPIPEAYDIISKLEGYEAMFCPAITREELLALMPKCHALVCRMRTKVDKELVDLSPNLKIVAKAGAGVEHIDLDYCRSKGIVVTNAPTGNSVATAEYSFALMMAAARNMCRCDRLVKAGKWMETPKYPGVELWQKTLGIIGCGNIGRIMGNRALAFEMTVLAYDPYVSEDALRAQGFVPATLDELYAKSDFISLHVPLLPSTAGMLNKEAFAKMKDGVRIVNDCRGGLVNEQELADAIISGKVAAYGGDTFSTEPIAPDNPLLGLEQVITTAHYGGIAQECMPRVHKTAGNAVVCYLSGLPLPVDAKNLTTEYR